MLQIESKSLDAGENVWKGHRGSILLGFAVIIAIVILFCPIISQQHTAAGTRFLQYDSSLGWFGSVGGSTPSQSSIQLTVTNKDLIDGNFSVTLYLWNKTNQPYQLSSNSLETRPIEAGASQVFSVPNDWISNGDLSITRDYAYNSQYLINYSVVSPLAPYNATQTEWKSIFALLFGS
jgi:hypothetical protein